MKKLLLIATPLLLSISSAFSQERPRNFDNFDSQRGVQVFCPLSPSQAYKHTDAADDDSDERVVSRYAAPPSRNKLVKKTAMVSMTVYDGFAQREALPRSEAPAPYETAHLTMTAGKLLKGYSTGSPLIDSYILNSCRRYDVDPLLIYSQMNQESSFKVHATSNKGASGLMQLMPATARRMGVTDIYDPRQNIEGGVKYMRLLLDMFGGDVNLALAGYNAGEGAVMKYGNQIPPYKETQDYVHRISSRYRGISNPVKASYGRPAANKRLSNTYQPDPVTSRMADGRPRLVNK